MLGIPPPHHITIKFQSGPRAPSPQLSLNRIKHEVTRNTLVPGKVRQAISHKINKPAGISSNVIPRSQKVLKAFSSERKSTATLKRHVRVFSEISPVLLQRSPFTDSHKRNQTHSKLKSKPNQLNEQCRPGFLSMTPSPQMSGYKGNRKLPLLYPCFL